MDLKASSQPTEFCQQALVQVCYYMMCKTDKMDLRKITFWSNGWGLLTQQMFLIVQRIFKWIYWKKDDAVKMLTW